MIKYFTNNFSVINLYKKPSVKSEIVTQMIYGESFSISKRINKWLKIKIKEELDNNWEVLTEAVQTLMRYEGIPDAYEQLKNLSRGSKLNKETYISFIKKLTISKESKNKLLQLEPRTYIGIAEDLSKN